MGKSIGKNISKNLSRTQAKQSATGALKTTSRRVIQRKQKQLVT